MAAIKTGDRSNEEADGSAVTSVRIRARNLHAIYWAIGLAIAAGLYFVVAGPPVRQALIPIAIATTPLVARQPETRYRTCAVALILMIVFVILGSPSIGLFYIPSAVALAMSCSKERGTNAA